MMIKNTMTSVEAENLINVFKKINTVLNVLSFDPPQFKKDIEFLIEKRNAARKEKNWDIADQIRLELENRGIEIKDI